jgi:alanine-glyoxylate transaminase / serine-glyoxylate transaminase / serine-pyruvate transaminase
MSSLPPSLDQILPSPLPLLMGAGPVPIPDSVAKANGLVINHLGETMNQIVMGINQMGRSLFKTQSEKIFGISGPSSAAMEMAVSSLLWTGRKVLILNLGTFSARFGDIARGVGAQVTELQTSPLTTFTPEDVKEAFSKDHFDVITLVHGETSCGIKNIYLPEIAQIAKAYGARIIVDAVTTLSTMPVEMDEWELDIVFTGGQKGLSAVAGVSLIAFSEDCFNFIMNRAAPMPHWCLDPRRAYKFWVMHEYHYTAPVNGVLALYEALHLICLETLERRFERHEKSSLTLQHCLEVMGLELYAPKGHRLNSVLSIKNKDQVDTKKLLLIMRTKFGVEISGAFGLDIVRIGQMGEQARPQNVRRVLEALGRAYENLSVKVDVDSGLKAFDQTTISDSHIRL